MKRNTDVSRMRPAEIPEPAGTGARPTSRDAAMERATVLLVQGLQESEIPIANLGAALARMARTLGDAGAPLFETPGAVQDTGTDSRALRSALARDMALCIQNLQFHDRLTQKLSLARHILTGAQPDSLLTKVPNRPANESGLEGSIELF